MSESPDQARSGERIRLIGFAVLMVLAGFALRAVAGLPTLPGSMPTATQVVTQLNAPTLPLAPLAAVLVDAAWLLWLWVMASMVIELLVTVAEAVSHGARWVGHARRVADRVTLPVARRAVAAALALQVLSRPVLA